MKDKNNHAEITGTVIDGFKLDYETHIGKYYTTSLCVRRMSNTADIIPIVVSERLVDVGAPWGGRTVRVAGQFNSHSSHKDGKSHLDFSISADEFEELDGAPGSDINNISLNGFIYKRPAYRKTPLGREVCDIFLAVIHKYGIPDFIPCIAWYENARKARDFDIGTHLAVEGRIQSREYSKRISNTESETRVAYEVSINKMDVVLEG